MLRLNQFLISLYNAQVARKASITVPFSKHTWECAKALVHFGLLRSVRFRKLEEKTQYKERTGKKMYHAQIQCLLKYHDSTPLIRRVVLLSTPSRRLSWDYSTVVAQSGKPGNFLLLTQYGVLTETEALQAAIGGLPLCRIFLHPWRV